MSFNQNSSIIANCFCKNLFYRLNMNILDQNKGLNKHKKHINSLIYLLLEVDNPEFIYISSKIKENLRKKFLKN